MHAWATCPPAAAAAEHASSAAPRVVAAAAHHGAAAQRRPAAAGHWRRRRRRAAVVGAAGLASICDSDTDPRELEAFAERFKQRRIKLWRDAGRRGLCAGQPQDPGRGSLSRAPSAGSNRSRFANNMIALNPSSGVAEEAEGAQREKMNKPELFNRRREEAQADFHRRAREALPWRPTSRYQPRPSSENRCHRRETGPQKNVVRVWVHISKALLRI
ncbi:POU domain; class 4; transcription factor 1 [Camelus dromedarius]|uniref:POU domain n=1 Tax=Camelus dromedarius TaxID=9838 RepID=A0A5N4D9M9_CAMDR|nr:POU domain; class 4; transcription factor 1 [Camelus dromedarius]